MSMRVEIGNPGAGTTVVFDITDAASAAVAASVREALWVLKHSGDTWVKWSRENETPEQTEMRELVERNNELKKRALAVENDRLEEMLQGTTEGIGRVGDM